MKRIAGWFFLLSGLLSAGLASEVILSTYLRPPTASDLLFERVEKEMRIADWMFVFTFVGGLIASATPYLRQYLLSHRIGRIGKGAPWYVRPLQVTAAVAVFLFAFSGSPGVHLESGKWMTGGAHAPHWQLTTEQAYEFLWQDLRRYSSMMLFIGVMWVLLGYTLLRRRVSATGV